MTNYGDSVKKKCNNNHDFILSATKSGTQERFLLQSTGFVTAT